MNTKLEMLEDMFLNTQFEKHIAEMTKNKKENIERVYNYFVSHTEDQKRTVFCYTLLIPKK